MPGHPRRVSWWAPEKRRAVSPGLKLLSIHLAPPLRVRMRACAVSGPGVCSAAPPWPRLPPFGNCCPALSKGPGPAFMLLLAARWGTQRTGIAFPVCSSVTRGCLVLCPWHSLHSHIRAPSRGKIGHQEDSSRLWAFVYLKNDMYRGSFFFFHWNRFYFLAMKCYKHWSHLYFHQSVEFLEVNDYFRPSHCLVYICL